MENQKVGAMQFSIDLSQPIYEQIIDQIRSSIGKGEISLGEKIPSVRKLAQVLKINPNTVMRAYQELERDGLTEKRRGQGTFVTTSKDQVEAFRQSLAHQTLLDFLNKMEDLGYTKTDIMNFLSRN